MAKTPNLRARRSAGQRHALASVEREIRALDPNSRRKYLRDFAEAFRTYEVILDEAALHEALRAADIALVSDYHALPGAQRCAAALLEARALPGDRPIVLGVETVYSRDQHILDEWWRREIGPDEFRARIRFDTEWGYDWAPFYELLVTAREHAHAIYGLDCMPREDLRKIAARDRHAAAKIAEIRQRHPSAMIVTLFGESHLAPQHLPARTRELLPADRVLTVLQNVDALYWRVSGEQADRVPAVRVDADTICVFNATPLEKYESYRLCLDRWQREDATGPDLAPTLYNLINGLASFLGIERYSSHNHTQPRFLIDLLPEIYGPSAFSALRRRLERHRISPQEMEDRLGNEDGGCIYWPEVNAISVCEFQMLAASEAAASFLYAACQGMPQRHSTQAAGATDPEDAFYRSVLEHALADFGSRVLHPARVMFQESDLHAMHALTREDLERSTRLDFELARQFIDLALWHRDLEATLTKFEEFRETVAGQMPSASESNFLARQLGLLLGSDIYSAYLQGALTPGRVRRLFLAPHDGPEAAPRAYFDLVRGLRRLQRKANAASAGQ
jgi:Haem-binding uptake, Tiki superfamily, ChaN